MINITKNDAKTALRDAGRAGEHSLTLFNYGIASPYLLVWGILWIVAGIIGAISPDNTGVGWLVVDTLGIITTGYLLVGDSQYFAKNGVRSQGLSYISSITVVAAFIIMTFVIFAPVSGVEIQTFITILIASIYMILGFWTGRRLSVIGVVLAVLVLSAFFYTPTQFPLIVSILGGGALILGGLWMQRA